MEETNRVSTAVAPLVPPARLGALLIERRVQQGIDIVDMAQRSNGLFTATFLEDVERGRVALEDEYIDSLVGLYEVNAGPVIPQRHELILDIDHHELSVGNMAVSFDSLHTRDVLKRYVSLIYMLRGLEPGDDLVLRDRDLGVLGSSLGYSESAIRTEIYELIAAPGSVQRAKQVGKGRILSAAGLLVGLTAVGALVLVGGGTNNDSRTEVLGTQQTTLVSSFATDIGSAAEATIDYDFRGALSGWSISFADDHPDFLGVTRSEERSIVVHIESTATVKEVAEVLMHEVGHAIDLDRLTDADRAEWTRMRNMPATWWPGNGLPDFTVGAGDFAEAVAAYTTGSESSSIYGDFTAEQLDFVGKFLQTP